MNEAWQALMMINTISQLLIIHLNQFPILQWALFSEAETKGPRTKLRLGPCSTL